MEVHFITKLMTPSFLLLLLFLLPLPSTARGLQSPTPIPEFIKAKCNTTEFPHLCVSSLTSYAPVIGDSAIQMAHAALNVSLMSAHATSTTLTSLSTGGRMSAREGEAVSDCVEIVADAVDCLRKSLKQMGRLSGRDIGLRIDDVQTWVSAALTDDNTCMDGFGGEAMNEWVKTIVRGRVVKLAHLTSNALALIKDLTTSESALP